MLSQHAASPEMTFLNPLPEGIDCQRCHGPGQRHVALASEGAQTEQSREQIRAAIVNPKRLPPDRELEVCMQCHLETTSLDLPHAIRRFDRPPFSYVPGQPLGDFSVEFDRPGGMKTSGLQDRFEIAQGAYRLRQSQCYIQSAGKLRCTTCHDPHDIPRGPAAETHYNAVCEQCHAATLERTAAGPHTAGANCIACHMPKRRTDDVVHVTMTDHLIQRQKPAGDLLAPKPELIESPRYQGEVVPYYPAPLADNPENALYTAAAQVRDRRNLTEGLPRLANLLARYHPAQAGFYAELGQGYGAAGDWAKGVPYFEEAARRERTAYRLVQLGNALMQNGEFPRAEPVLREATGLAPDEPSGWATLGWVLWQQNKGAEARVDLERAVALDPDVPEVHNNLANVEWGTGDQAAAVQQFRRGAAHPAPVSPSGALEPRPCAGHARPDPRSALSIRADDSTEAGFSGSPAGLWPASVGSRRIQCRHSAAGNRRPVAAQSLASSFRIGYGPGAERQHSDRARAVDHRRQRLRCRGARPGAGSTTAPGTISCGADTFLPAPSDSEGKPPDDLAGPRLGPGPCDRVDVAIPTGQHSVSSRQRAVNGRRRPARGEPPGCLSAERKAEQPVEDVLEFGADEEIVPAFVAEPEIPAKAHRLGRLPLPAVVVDERSRSAPLPRPRIRPGGRVEDGLSLRIKASAVRIVKKRIHTIDTVVGIDRSPVETTPWRNNSLMSWVAG